MALNIILACLVAVSILNVLLVYDLYGRSAKLAVFAAEVNKFTTSIAHSMARIQNALTPKE